MRKSKEEVIKVLKNELSNVETLYKSNCINWTGKTKDTNIYTTEIIANELSKEVFDEIKEIERKESYCRDNHDGKTIKNSNRYEENFAKQIKGKKLNGLGSIMDYQVPLKNIESDKVGKIDIISFDEKTKMLYLIELKYGDNKETLLRAVLESYTYYKIVKGKKLIDDYFNNKQFNLFKDINPNQIILKPAVLLTQYCKANKELTEVIENKRPKLKKLIKNLGVYCFVGEVEFKIKNTNMKLL